MADFSRELWFASERSDEKQNIRMHQIRMRTFGCDLRTFGYEQRTMVSHPNSETELSGDGPLVRGDYQFTPHIQNVVRSGPNSMSFLHKVLRKNT